MCAYTLNKRLNIVFTTSRKLTGNGAPVNATQVIKNILRRLLTNNFMEETHLEASEDWQVPSYRLWRQPIFCTNFIVKPNSQNTKLIKFPTAFSIKQSHQIHMLTTMQVCVPSYQAFEGRWTHHQAVLQSSPSSTPHTWVLIPPEAS